MWRHISASVVGSSHASTNAPCQDHTQVTELADGSILLTCSDGAGSAAFSEFGSAIACLTLADELSLYTRDGGRLECIDRSTVSVWVTRIREKLEVQARALGVDLRELACTIVAAIVSSEGATFFQIGDGAIVTVAEDGPCEVVFWPDQGEYVNTTFFITTPDATERLQFERRSISVRDIAVFTDGLQTVALRYDEKKPHEPFFAPMFARLRADEDWQALADPLRGFLLSEALAKRSDDDKSLILASKI